MTSLLTDFSTALAHEIKNPVALAMAHVELARLSLEDTTHTKAHLSHIERALTDINNIVQDILFATYGNKPPIEIDVHEMLSEILNAYRVAWPGISFSLTAEPLLIYIQEDFLRMILTNLLKNAVEAADQTPHGFVLVSVKSTPQNLNITITNNATTQQKPYSTNLGISICHHLAAKINSHVDIIIEENGCEATVYMPRF